MKLDEILKRTNRHVAILGAFNLDPNQPKVMRSRASEVLEKLSFSLMSRRVQRMRNGNIPFYSYAVTAPAELAGKELSDEAIKTYQVLPDGDGVLSKYLKDPHGKPSDIGAELLKSLLDAGDALRPYEDSAFGIQLTEGLYYALDKEEAAIDLSATHEELVEIEQKIRESTAKHNAFLKELGLSPLSGPD